MASRKHEKLLARKLDAMTSTSDLHQRLRIVHEMQRIAAVLEEAVVAEARAAGLTWKEIGGQFGMTKQAAQQRFKDTSS